MDLLRVKLNHHLCMHCFWTVPELVRFTLDFLTRNEWAKVARCSRTLWEHAIPLIWADIPDCDVLKSIYPEGLVVPYTAGLEEWPNFTRTLDDQDWRRFHHHTRHTTRLGVPIALHSYFVYRQVLANKPSYPLFPALRSVRLDVSVGRGDDQIDDVLDIFLPSSVEELSIWLGYGREATCEWVLRSLAGRPEGNRLALTTLAVNTPFGDSTNYVPSVSIILGSQLDVRNLTLHLGNGETFRGMLEYATQYRRLEYLTLVYNSYRLKDSPEIGTLQPGVFSSLKGIQVTGDVKLVHDALRLVVPEMLEGVKVDVGSGDANQLLDSLGRLPNLKSIVITSTVFIPLKTLGQALRCRKLEHFAMVVDCYGGLAGITESDFQSMGRAWPRLATLSITTNAINWAGFDVRNMTLRLSHLRFIAAAFPNLRKLSVCITPHTHGGDDAVPALPSREIPTPNEALLELDVGMSSETEELHSIVWKLRRWYPGLRTLVWNKSGPSAALWADVSANLEW